MNCDIMRHKILFFALLILVVTTMVADGKKIGKSRGSSSGSRQRTNYKPQQSSASLSYPNSQPVNKQSFTGWQQKPAARQQTTGSKQSKPSSQTHSYPSSQTGMSGNNAPKQPPPGYQESVQKSHSYPQATGNHNHQQSNPAYPASNGLSGASGNNQQNNHAYPASTGLSGAGAGARYPQQQGSGLSGAPSPQYPQTGSANTNHQGYRGVNPPTNAGNTHYGQHQGPPPPYPGNYGPGYGGHGYNNPSYGGGGGYGPPQMPGYFGNYANNGRGFGAVNRGSNVLTGLGIAGAGVGTILTGLALWNLARATGRPHHTVIYDKGQPVAVAPDNNTNTAMDSWLADLVNCSLTISSVNATEVLAIPCAIATSFTPEADVKDSGINNKAPEDTTKCTVGVLTKSGKEYMTTIPCSVLLSTAAENNVTEVPFAAENVTVSQNVTQNVTENMPIQNITDQSAAMTLQSTDVTGDSRNCQKESGDIRDSINPCYAINNNLSVIPLENINKEELATPISA